MNFPTSSGSSPFGSPSSKSHKTDDDYLPIIRRDGEISLPVSELMREALHHFSNLSEDSNRSTGDATSTRKLGSILDVPPRAFQRSIEHEKRREGNQASQQTASSSGHRFDSEVTHTTNAIPMTPNRSQQWLSLHPNVSGTPGLASNSPCIEDVPLPPFSSMERPSDRFRNQPRPMRGNGPGVPPLFPDFMMPVSHREVARMAKEKRVPYRAPSPHPHEQTASHVVEQSSAGSARRSRRVDDMVEDEDAAVAGPSTRDAGAESSVGPVRQPRRTRGRGKKSANTSARKPRRK